MKGKIMSVFSMSELASLGFDLHGSFGVCQAIARSIKPDWRLGLACQGNWPATGDQEFGLQLDYNDRDFGNSKSTMVKFFDTEEEAKAYASNEELRLAQNGWVQGCRVGLYQWDLGPTLIWSDTLS